MKNYTLLLLLAGISLFTLSAASQPKAGLKAGVNYGGLSGYSDGKKAGFHIGIFLQNGKSKKFKFQPELLYQQVAQDYQAEVNEIFVTNTLSVGMATLPLMFQYYAGKNFYLEGGPQFSVITGAKDKGAGGGKANVRRNLSNTQFAFNLGMGMELQKRISLYVRYQAGFTDITLYDTGNDFVRVLQAGVAYRFK